MRTHADPRRLFLGDLFDTPDGDVNLVRLYPGSVCAWHRHQKQTDRLFCVTGAVRIGLIRMPEGYSIHSPYPVEWFVLDERSPGPLTIPPDTWHGYGAITDPCILLQYNTPKYNPADEERQPLKKLPWDSGTIS